MGSGAGTVRVEESEFPGLLGGESAVELDERGENVLLTRGMTAITAFPSRATRRAISQ